MQDGIALNDGAFFLSDGVMAVALALALVAGVAVFLGVARPRLLFGRKRTGGSSGRKLGLFLGILAAMAVLVFPLLLCIQQGQVITAIPLLGVRLMQAIVLDNGYVDYIGGMPTGGLATLYYCLVASGYVALPLLAALNVYDLVVQNLQSAQAAWTVGVSSRGKNVYLFSDFNRKTYGLAQDVLAHDDRALVIFAAMSKLERDTWSTEVAKLGPDGVKCFEADYPDMAARLCRPFGFSQLRCFAISSSNERDVSETCRLIGQLRADGGAFSGSDGSEKVARVQVYVACDSADDQVVLDAANGKDGPGKAAVPSLRLTVLNEASMAVYDLLDRAPLYRVFGDLPLGPLGLRPAKAIDLCVLVVGSGRYAEEALKAVLWYGQMYNVTLKVNVAASDADIMRDRVYQRYPALQDADRFSLRFTGVRVQSPAFDSGYLAHYAAEPHVYAIVAIEDDALSYEAALHMRRFFMERHADEGSAEGKVQRPFVSCLMRDEAMSQLIAARFDECAAGVYGLTPFGCSRRIFSYSGVIASPLEEAGQRAADLYDALWKGMPGADFAAEVVNVVRLRNVVAAAVEEYAGMRASGSSRVSGAVPVDGGIACLPQIRHYSNLALALHARYKAWALDVEMRRAGGIEAGADIRNMPVETGLLLGTVEHDRWTVFYQTQGYTYLSPDERQRYARMLRGDNVVQKVEPFRKHTLVCPNAEIWENYAHAVAGFSYLVPSPLRASKGDGVQGEGLVEVHTLQVCAVDGKGAPVRGLALQLLDADYCVVDEWVADACVHETRGLPAGNYIVHPAAALPGFECACDLSVSIGGPSASEDGASVGPALQLQVNVEGKPQVNPVIYDWAFAFASPYVLR